MRPIIGMNNYVAEGLFNEEFYHQVPRFYGEVLDKSGACVIQFPLVKNSENIERYISMIDGLLIPGGEDVDPVEYGENPHPRLERTVPKRDEFEIALLKEALKQKKPIMTICRGMQILNVVLGGTLYQDILSQHKDAMPHLQSAAFFNPWHKVEIEKGSILHGIYGDELRVNSGHHQALKDVSDKLKVVAKAPDGIVEAIESNIDGQFIIGLQWHPEMMYEKDEKHAKIFKYFVDHIKNN